jgi:glycosyltransferase involved in cell wall biosynthesis
MTDPLGQSQVIPYLQGLSGKGRKFWLVSFEKPDRYREFGGDIRLLLESAGIVWVPLMYTARPPVLSTVYDIFRMRQKVFHLVRKEGIDLIHCRSYIAALTGLWSKRKFTTRFIFDMRGFWADERVDGGLWDTSKWVYRNIYKFFKRMELVFLREADAIVSLTENARREIRSWPGFSSLRIDVIPCCADLDLFAAASVSPLVKEQLRRKAGISADSFVLSYLGSVGTWYMLPEMLRLFKILLEKRSNAVFLMITPDSPELILREAKRIIPEVAPAKLIILKAGRKDVPAWASLSDVSVFFIRPLYSKKASSPTKMAELMGLGIPLICNSGVGDVEEILEQGGNGLIIHSFEDQDLRQSLESLDEVLASDPDASVACAREVYSLEEGVRRYDQIYQRLHS